MKIIATINSSTYLCEITTTELALLRGFKNASDPLFNEKWRGINEEFDITKGINTLDTVRNLDRDRIQLVITKLQLLVSSMTEIKDVVDGLNLFDTLSKDVK